MVLKDYKGIFKKNTLIFKQSSNPLGDYYVFDFESDNLTWETGEHAFFSFPQKIKKDRGWRAFSIASNSEE